MITEMGGPSERSASRAFWWRLTDNLFRRLPLFVLPVVLLGAVGFQQASNTLELYRSTATLSTSTNPLVPEQEISEAVSRGFYEAPAATASRTLNERLRTDSFVTSIAEAAGLGDAVDSGALRLDVIRSSVRSSTGGASIFSVTAQWANPQVSHALVSATVDAYQQFLEDSLASDAAEAQAFYIDRLAELSAEQAEASETLSEYVAGLPPLESGEQYPVTVTVEIERRTAALTAVEDRVASVETSLQAARLQEAQLKTEAGRSLTMIDLPEVPSEPESTLIDRTTTVISYTALGTILAAAALLITTVLDRSVASTADLVALDGIMLAATVPTVQFPSQSPRTESRRRRRRRSGPAQEATTPGPSG